MMNELEANLRREETSYLQEKLRTNSYMEEATAIAHRILTERNAPIPTPETEEEQEAKYQNNGKVSLILLLLSVVYVIALYFGNVTTGRFLVFTFLYVVAFRYTLSLRKK
jgi:hypothetical protein